MLQSIHVKNFALIDDLEIDLTKGLNVITGETGAGKSIVIDAVNFALGKRMQGDIVREDSDFAFSELVFTIENDAIREKIKELDIDSEDDLIILSRKIVNGRNTCKVNGETVTTATLKQLSPLLIDIHGQHEHQSLLNKNKHIDILDSCLSDKDKKILALIEEKYKEYSAIKKELNEALNTDSNKDREASLCAYEIKEIEDAKLVIGEDEELENSYRKMTNSKKIAESVITAHQMTGYEDGAAGSLIGRSVSLIKQAAGLDEELASLLEVLTDIDGILNDFNKSIADYEESLAFEEEDFRNVEMRLDLINSLKNKYGRTIEDILDYLAKREEDLRKYEDYDQYVLSLKGKEETVRKELLELCKQISSAREKQAKLLSKDIKDSLTYLNFLDSNFEVSVTKNEDNLSSKGYDDVEMLISTNPGEKLKPLVNVASGGEVSRIMLSIKSALADKDNIPTLIFDEIDTGISGRTAQKVSEKISVISKDHQVLLVTHLPQIASMADTHFEISKAVSDGRTVTSVRELNEEEEINELARMLSGAEITDAVIASAKEMKKLAKEINN